MMQVEVDDVLEGGTLLEAVVCFKWMNEDGDVLFGTRATKGLRTPEAIGMMHMAIADQTNVMLGITVHHRDDE